MADEFVYDDYNEDELSHIGVKRRSGRYPWGSGDDPEQRCRSFLGTVDDLKKKGLSQVEIAKGMGIKTTELRARITLANQEIYNQEYSRALRLKEKGYGNTKIGEIMGKNESSVRSLLDPAIRERKLMLSKTADVLRDAVEKKKYVDVGAGVEAHMGITRTKLNGAIAELEQEGYKVHPLKVTQAGTGQNTILKILGGPDSDWKEVNANKDKIRQITDYTEDGGRSYLGVERVNSVSSKRVLIKYNEEGGALKDGVVELRRNVPDISLDGKNYAQVRIGVDDKYYMKGMAMYSDEIPKGYDMIYNTNKKKGTPMEDVYKKMKKDKLTGEIDHDNPFGATIRQKKYLDKDGKEKLSAINIVYNEGEWGDWSKTLSSQVLSKQSPKLAKELLEKRFEKHQKEYDEVSKLTNPVVKKVLLEALADGADSASVHLKAASIPRQATHVLLPFPKMKENEIYAPNYNNGEKVALIRYPHGGIFEIVQLTVNNKFQDAIKSIGKAKDAVGIHPKNAETLSGADFDGDTALVIPNNSNKIKSMAPLEQLKNFDPKIAYPKYPGMPIISSKKKQTEMGNVSNLITDMTIKGASFAEIASAVKHSMCIIDAEKHELNYKQSYIDNRIGSLKEKYQGSKTAGAQTIISRASSQKRVDPRKVTIDPKTGKKIYEDRPETYVNKEGKTVKRTIMSTKMAEVDDAMKLVGDKNNAMEIVYATHANKLKALANTARKEMLSTPNMVYSPLANKMYKEEVAALKSKLNTAIKNKPLERQAQILANAYMKQKRASNPDMDKDTIKKYKFQSLAQARVNVGAQTPGLKKEGIVLTNREWLAIQSGAVSTSVLREILLNTDLDKIKQLATPRTKVKISDYQAKRIKAMLAAGRTQAEIAGALGISTSAVNDYI